MKEPIFAGKTALVTGASRGIGRGISLMLAEHGARVAVNYLHNEEAAAEVVALIADMGGEESLAVQGDVASQEDVRGMVEATTGRLGPIDLLVNNAGIVEHGSHEKVDFASWKRMFGVNVDGPAFDVLLYGLNPADSLRPRVLLFITKGEPGG